MIKIKISTDFPDFPIQRQTPGSKGLWGNCQFFVNKDIEECDWWVVYDGLLGEEKVKCPHGNTILITGEPPGVRKYDKKFLNQFAKIVTCHRDFNHPSIIYAQQGLPWHVGRRVKDDGSVSYSKDYDELKPLKTFNKDELISVISSNKTFTQGHKKRFEFVKRLSEHFGSKLDVFGRGIRDVEDKWDAISEYKYHIVLENSACPDYWTEKLSDAFLGGAYPFYYGCPNISDYFPAGALTSVDIGDFAGTVAIIEKAIKNQQYERSIVDINVARELILDKYNIFAVLCNMCDVKGVNLNQDFISLAPENIAATNILKKFLRLKLDLGFNLNLKVK